MTKLYAKNVFLVFHTNIFLLIKFQHQLTYWPPCNSLFNWESVSYYLLILLNEGSEKKFSFYSLVDKVICLLITNKYLFYLFIYLKISIYFIYLFENKYLLLVDK